MAAPKWATGSLSRRQLLLASLAVGVLAGASPVVAGATPDVRLPAPLLGGTPTQLRKDGTLADGGVSPSALKWVQLTPQTLANWTLSQDSADGNRFTLTPKNLGSLSSPPKRVLVLYTKPLSSFDDTLTAILSVLSAKQVPVTVTLLNFEQKDDRLKAGLAFGEAAKFDLLAPMGSEATQSVHDAYQGGALPTLSLFTKDPVLQGYLKDFNTGSGTNLAYCTNAVPIEEQMTYLRELKGDVKNIAVLYSDTSRSTLEAQVTPLKALATQQGINVLNVVVHSDTNPAPEFNVAVPQAITAMTASDPGLQRSVFWATGTTAVINSIDLLSQLCGNIPMLSVYPELVKEGPGSAILSVGVANVNLGLLDANYMLDILYNGKKPATLKAGVVSPPDLAISFMKSRQIGLEIPFNFFENAGYVYDHNGKVVRSNGQTVAGA
jgi:putative tryptophan/tyrosine transport system substrate-binding protein